MAENTAGGNAAQQLTGNRAEDTPQLAPNGLGPREAASLNLMMVNAVREVIGRRLGDGGDNLDALYETFGYKRSLTYMDFARRYRRQDVAKRIINGTVDTTWKSMPEFRDSDTSQEADTRFEQDVKKLLKKFGLISKCKRADKLACIGRYSIMVIGNKHSKLSDPLKTDMTDVDDIAYISVYSENQATIGEYYTDTGSDLFGKPKMYNISTASTDVEDRGQKTGASQPQSVIQVHASRVIHVVDEILETEVFGVPKLEAVINLLDDLLKISGGGAEMFWLGAYQGMVFNVKDNYNLTPEDGKAMNEEIEKYVNKLQRFIKTRGIEVTTLGSTVSSPQYHFDMIIGLIAGASNIPKRILLGSEAGQLASSQDQDNFFSYISSRRNEFAENIILRPLIDKLVEAGAIDKPQGGEYEVAWKPLFEQTPTERATNASNIANAAKAMSPLGDATEVITVPEFREMIGLKATPDKGKGETEEDEDELDLDALPNQPMEGDPRTGVKPERQQPEEEVTEAVDEADTEEADDGSEDEEEE